jgi:hypothetical protein
LISRVAADLNSPGFFKLVGQGSWPPGDEGLDTFFALHSEDVQAITKWSLTRSPKGRTWQGLFHLMQDKGYVHVREMGEEAATAWARHLGVTEQADAGHCREGSVSA